MSEEISQDVNIKGEGNIVVGKGDVIIHPLPPAEARLRHDLGILLRNVENTWIKGVLEKSVHEAALIELGMELREEAVDNPWRMVMEGPEHPRETLPRGKKIKDIFYEANGLLLILGEPGSGKTTTLLQLARDLISEVDSDFTQPVPFILNISTWTDKQQPLDEWLIAELNGKYRLPKKDGKKWLRERRILPLLDGLDEVKAENRAACVENINQLASNYGLQGLVVCSRIKDYTDLNVRLAFYRAIYVQPLTPEQIDKYLDQAGDQLASLRATLQSDESLRNMAQSPLILNIMSLAYQDTSSESLSNSALNTKEARSRHLFDTYIARMFNRKAKQQEFDTEQTKQRLMWLARNMQLHNQEVFLIEDLQPSWLQTSSWRFVYTLASRLLSGLIFGLSVGLSEGLSVGLNVGLSVGLPLSIIDILRFEWLDKWRDRKKVQDFWWSVINIASVWLILVLITSLSVRRMVVLIFVLIFGLIFGIRGSRKKLKNDIQTVEALQWSWRKAIKGGLIFGLTCGLIFGLIFGLYNGPPVGLIFGLTGAFFFGLNPAIIETKITPNQGIRLSSRNALFGGLFVGLSVWLSVALNFALFIGLREGLSLGLSIGLNDGLILGLLAGSAGTLWYGGLDVIQHCTLRVILIIQGHTPRNYAQFLDYAVDRIFLQKVGGGYRFIHRLLLEHFADIGEKESELNNYHK